jgi:four helix bundle protein
LLWTPWQTFRSFVEIEAWQKARELTGLVYVATRSAGFSKDFALRDQVRRASISIMASIAEGFGRSGSVEFIQFLAVAKGSACEVISHVYVALDQGYVSQEEFDRLNSLAEKTVDLIGGPMRYLQKSSIKGAKYKR